MKGITTKIKHQVCYVKIIDTVNSRDDIKIGEQIRGNYDCIIKITYFFIQFEIIFFKRGMWVGICKIFQHVPPLFKEWVGEVHVGTHIVFERQRDQMHHHSVVHETNSRKIYSCLWSRYASYQSFCQTQKTTLSL